MKLLLSGLMLLVSMSSFATEFKCTTYATTTSSDAPEVIFLRVDGAKVNFGSNDRNRGQWGLILSTENVDGIKVLQLSLMTGRQNALVASSSADPSSRAIGLSVNTNLFADILCTNHFYPCHWMDQMYSLSNEVYLQQFPQGLLIQN